MMINDHMGKTYQCLKFNRIVEMTIIVVKIKRKEPKITSGFDAMISVYVMDGYGGCFSIEIKM